MASRWRSQRAEPQPLARVMSELVALRGYAGTQRNTQLQAAWAQVAGEVFAAQTKALAIRSGVLHIAVASAPLLAQLVGFHRVEFLDQFREQFGHLKIRDLKFRLDSGIDTTRRNRQRLPDG